MPDLLEIVLAAIVGVVGVARLTRLVVDDDFPPVVWLRTLYLSHTSASWGVLVSCPFCVAPYFGALALAWAEVSHLHWTWWVFWGWLAGSYVASMIVVRDTPPE